MKEKKKLQNSVPEIDVLVWRMVKLLIKSKRHLLEKVGLTCSQFDILSAICHFTDMETEIIQVDLSEKTGIDPMTTSTILRNLERKGLITRHRSTVNTRAILINLTDEGFGLLKQANSRVRLLNKKIYENTDKDVLTSQLLKLMEKLNN